MAGRVRGILEQLLGRRPIAAVSDGVTDSELLHRFAATRDEAAFELLVWRHGAMVLGLCRRAIRDEQLAEDAFQAVFLVLARKAATIRNGNVGGWLFRVARRVSSRAAKTRQPVTLLVDRPANPQPSVAEQQELTELLDAEVSRLPDRLRRAVILCYLGGRTTEDAARELGCPRGTVLSRLATARKRLVARLTRRGVFAPALAITAAESTIGRLVSQTVSLVKTPLNTPAATAPVLLAESVVRAMATTKFALVCGVVFLATGLSLSVGWVAAGTGSDEAGSAQAAPVVHTDQPPAPPTKAGDQKDTKPADKTFLLRTQSERIAREITTLQDFIAREAPEADNVIDISVLQSELFAIDKSILAAESQTKVQARAFERATKEQERIAKQPLDERELGMLIWQDRDVDVGKARLAKATETVASLKLKFAGDNPVVQAAVKEVVDAEAALKTVRETTRPRIEREMRERLTKFYADGVAAAKEQIHLAQDNLEELLVTRKKLAVRIAETRQGDAKRQAFLDEHKVLREIQLELLRHRTITELGIEGLQQRTARPETDPKVEAQLKDLRREIEVLRAEVEKLRKKN